MPLGALLGTVGGEMLAGAAVAGVGVEAYNAYDASQIAGSQLSMAQGVYGEQQYFANQLMQLINNPSSVTNLPGYQFQLNQGLQALQRQGAGSQGVGQGPTAPGSGATQEAMVAYGEGYAQNFYQAQTQLLSQLSGLTSASSPAQYGQVASNAQSSSANQLNNLLSELGIMYGLNSGSFGSAGGAAGTAAQGAQLSAAGISPAGYILGASQ